MTPNRNSKKIVFLFLLPNLLGVCFFVLIPLGISLLGSFTTWSLKPNVPLEFVGFDNYVFLLKDPKFYFYLFNTAYYMLGLPISIGGSLLLAVLLNQKLRFSSPVMRNRLAFVMIGTAALFGALFAISGSVDLAFVMGALVLVSSMGFVFKTISYRTIYYLPHFTAGAATIMLWMQLYNPEFGLINQAIDAICDFLGVNLEAPGWLSSTDSILGFLPLPDHFNNSGLGFGARESILIMGIWAGIGGNSMLIYLAALSNIDVQLYEAADVDGASEWQKFWHITLPQLAPTTFFLVTMGVISSLQAGFEATRIMTQGGPAGVTTTLSYYIYVQGFERLDLAYGAAISWVLFLIIFGITLLNWRYGRKHAEE